MFVNKVCAIFDIDNVYTDSRKWESQIPKVSNRENWDKHHANIGMATPNKPMIERAIKLNKLFPIVFITAREDHGTMRTSSIKQIEEFSEGKIKIGDRNELFMRGEGDFRPSPIVKEEILKALKIKGYRPVVAFDDDKRNADMFNKNNVLCKVYDINKERKLDING